MIVVDDKGGDAESTHTNARTLTQPGATPDWAAPGAPNTRGARRVARQSPHQDDDDSALTGHYCRDTISI